MGNKDSTFSFNVAKFMTKKKNFYIVKFVYYDTKKKIFQNMKVITFSYTIT